MLKNMLKFALVIILLEVVLFFAMSRIIGNKFGGLKNILSKDILNKDILSKLKQEEILSKIKHDVPEVKSRETVISKGLVKQPRLLLVPVWIGENTYFKMTDDPIYIKVSNIGAGNEDCASVEIKYADGKSQSFDKVKKGERLSIYANKYFVELIDLNTGEERAAWTRGGNSAKIALYENTL